jgi:hypothetical protein
MVAILAGGLERVSHIDDVKHDPGLALWVGLPQLPDRATFSRFLGDATPSALRDPSASTSPLATALRRPTRPNLLSCMMWVQSLSSGSHVMDATGTAWFHDVELVAQ